MATLDGRRACWQRGDTVVIRERWRDRLWSAVPHIAVEPYLTYLPDGTRATYASSVGVPGREALPRAERKLAALQTCIYRVVEQSIGLTMLHFFTPGSHARVNLGWTSDNTFTGWYVNLERPVTVHDDGLETMDLVLDLHIEPDGRWQWKDREHFDEAVRRGVLDAELLPVLEADAGRVLAELDRAEGPFAPAWRTWRPDPQWTVPQLPEVYRVGGSAWQLR
jgi:predicted RNA-binding protein associated with RNAse of E/G family